MDYQELVRVYEQLESTTKRLEKTHVLAEFLKSADELDMIMLLVQGKVFPSWDSRELGIASKLAVKAIGTATGASAEAIDKVWRETGDLGETAKQLCTAKSQATLFSETLTVGKVFANLQKLASLEGTGTVERKMQLIAELLSNASPREAKYVLRTVLGDLRVGLGEGTLRDAIVWAFFAEEAGVEFKEGKLELEDREVYNNYAALVQRALDITNDFGEVAQLAKREGEEGVAKVSLRPGKPSKVMLYQKATSIENAFERVGSPAAFEYKYDGFMAQIHKTQGKVLLFTRRLENVTTQFPDVIESVSKHVSADEFIFDAEIVGVGKDGKYLPFQTVSQRIKRKYDIKAMAAKFPVEVNVFDVTFLEGRSMLQVPFKERRGKVDALVANVPGQIKPAIQIITGKKEEAEKFYQQALASGNEGVMAKNIEGTYKPGSRVGYGVKVKPTMDTLEVVIVGAEWGEGKRGQWLASFIVAVRDPDTEEFKEVGRVGTGVKEKPEEGLSFGELTEMLSPLIVEESGREVRVKPEVIIEVDYEEIQSSPTYSSGFALRFPRVVKLRSDRSTSDINTTSDVEALHASQRGRKV